MAKQNRCSVCQKEAGICNCAGCKAFFCTKDFIDHRQWLSSEYEKVVEARNHFQQEMNEGRQSKMLQNTLLSQIDQWQNNTIEVIRYVAEKTRNQVIRLLDDKIKDMESGFDNLTRQLRELQEMNNYVEGDLTCFKQIIEGLEEKLKELNEPSSIKLNKDRSEQIEWTAVIYVSDEPVHDDKVNVSCISADANCSWIGPLDELDDHLTTCSFSSRRSKLQKLRATNEQLKGQIRQQKTRINASEFETQKLKEQLVKREIQITEVETMMYQLNEQIEQQNIQIKTKEAEIELTKEQVKQRDSQLRTTESQLSELREEIKKQKNRIHAQDAEIRHTKEQVKQQDSQLRTTESQLSELKQETKKQKARIDVQDTEIQETQEQLNQHKNQLWSYGIQLPRLERETRQQKTQIDMYQAKIWQLEKQSEKQVANINASTYVTKQQYDEIGLITLQLEEKENCEYVHIAFKGKTL